MNYQNGQPQNMNTLRTPACPMKRPILSLLVVLVLASVASPPLPAEQADPARNPLIWADVPDIAIMRVGNTYYMSSTTMHMSPGVPIMKSKDLVNWQIVNYAYDILDDVDALNLTDGKRAYGKGSWASYPERQRTMRVGCASWLSAASLVG